MPKTALTQCLKDMVITSLGKYETWTNEELQRWVTNMGGRWTARLNDSTTHLLTNKRMWKQQHDTVIRALENKVKILDFSWLQQCTITGRKAAMKNYDFAATDRETVQTRKKKDKEAKQAAKAQAKQKAPVRPSMMNEVRNHIGSFEPHGQKRKRVATDASQQPFNKTSLLALQTFNKEHEFNRGRLMAREDLHSDCHVIYDDETDGFPYDVALIKTHMASSANQRVQLTIYQSTDQPLTYALHERTNGAGLAATQTVLVPKGSSFDRAMRKFKHEFKARTGIAWDDRIKYCERRKTPRNNVFHEFTSAGVKTSVEVPERNLSKAHRAELEKRPYEYRLPAEGEPIGLLQSSLGPRLVVEEEDLTNIDVERPMRSRTITAEETQQAAAEKKSLSTSSTMQIYDLPDEPMSTPPRQRAEEQTLTTEIAIEDTCTVEGPPDTIVTIQNPDGTWGLDTVAAVSNVEGGCSPDHGYGDLFRPWLVNEHIHRRESRVVISPADRSDRSDSAAVVMVVGSTEEGQDLTTTTVHDGSNDDTEMTDLNDTQTSFMTAPLL